MPLALLIAALGLAAADQTDKYIQAHQKRIKAKSSLERLTGVNGLGSIGVRSAVALPKLTEMLKGDPDPAVRRAVASSLPRISPEGVEDALFEAARSDSDAEVRETAAKGLREGAHLVEVVRAEKVATLRRRAARRIQDAALIQLAGEAPVEIRRDALMFIKDQEAVARLARTLTSAEARRDAVAALRLEKVLAEIGKNDPDASVREWALLAAKAKGRQDLTLDKMDCKRGGGYANAECQITITNRGVVAYEAIEYDSDMGISMIEIRDKAAIGTRSYLDGVLEPGESRSTSVTVYANPYAKSVAVGITGCRSLPPAAKK
jgi:hypothetical protein